ncbi:tetratricopeptide repeat protein [Oscillochloris sp. ZM17-4]|uniref:tetratricopeptide repeat protein n=1 Tax=Oscillochloris sp. ZM17-4 TaxID=2866714 RepID=UPI001C73C6E2|nr:tetratricopeptide repeat protein [Oscillochloris sp. ZM17-4]MBX0330502.1 tetratricopeptide repeat protein [Oscillochloris sp. ZM17-4]
MKSPPPDTDLRPREFGVALLMAAAWYFLGPWGIIPTIWFAYLIVQAQPGWIDVGTRLLPVAQRRALSDGAATARQQWRQLTAPWREIDATGASRALPAWGDNDPLAETGNDAPALPVITLAELAQSPNILLVGGPGSGKTTLLHALIAARPWRAYVLDPHAHPDKWPASATTIGGGRDFAAIYALLRRAEGELTKRAQILSRDAAARFARFALAGDEWGSVASEIGHAKDEDPPGRLLLRLLKEGRKFGISFLGAAHGDTAASLGCSGDTAAFRNSFDWFVYMGGFVPRELKDQPALLRRLPTTRTPEGKTLPLVAIAVSPISGERRLLDLRGIDRVAAVRYFSLIGEYQEAWRYCERALALRTQELGPDHPDVARSLRSRAWFWRDTPDIPLTTSDLVPVADALQQAEEDLVESIRILKIKKNIEYNQDIALAYSDLGAVYGFRHDYIQSEKYFTLALSLQISILGENHRHTLHTQHNLAVIYHLTGEIDKAFAIYERLYSIFKRLLGEKHPQVGTLMCNIGEIYRSKENLPAAIDYFDQAHQIHRAAYGAEHDETRETKRLLDEAYAKYQATSE